MKSRTKPKLRALSVALTVFLLSAVLTSAVYAATVTTTVDNSTGIVGWFTSLTLNSSGFPVISYYDYDNQDLKVAVCGDATCSTTPTITTVDNSTGIVGWYTSLALNSSGFPVISYYDATNGNLKVAVCTDAICTNKTTNIVDGNTVGQDVGQYTSLALNSSGFPVISYWDIANRDLKVAVCTDATCTTVITPNTVDSTVDVGQYTSLALNSSGNPVISYYDSTNHNLKVAVCTNATCGTKTLKNIDYEGDVGQYTSLALNSSGAPVISYLDYTNQDLKVAVVTPPTVGSTSVLSTYTTTGPSSFTVTFSENVYNPAGDSNTDDVTNPANYWVVNKGPNGLVDTVSCLAGLAGDDTKATVSGVIYTPNTAVVTLASALPVGSYRLFVCGTTSIVDLALNPLGGGADRTSDFTVTATTGTSGGTITSDSLPRTGFAPNVVTVLPAQPAKLAYSELGSLWLEIPSQKIKVNIVGVPKSENAWDVKWLGADAGWLNGTAFPTWEGNSVLTAHVTDSNGLPGPFANLKDLKYGDQIIVHLYGDQYTFEVRNSRLVRPYSGSFAFKHLEGNSYLTLITCQGYNATSDSYRFRRIVRAVLVSVK